MIKKLKWLIRRIKKRGYIMNPNERINRGMNLEYFTPNEIDDFLKEIGDNFKLLKNNKRIQYYNIPCAFDIETTSMSEHSDKKAFMYEWTLGINWVIMIGRTWEELKMVMEKIVEHFQLNVNRRLLIFVHNLSFEFQAFRNHFEWEKIFALEERKPVQCLTKEGIEFRCSYILSGYSLANVGKQLQKYKVNKMKGDLDYDLIRHSNTPLTSDELRYCICDVLVVMAYIQEKIENDGNITKLQLTKTGYVRKYCRDNCLYSDKSHRGDVKKYKKYRNLMNSLTLEPNEYELLKEGFMGGFTHANPYMSRGVITNVASYDFTSSYPAVIISEKFPMSKGEFYEPKNKDDFNNQLNNYCCIFEIGFKNLRPKFHYENYIPVSKTRHSKNVIENNGRVVSADYLEITLTEQDLFIINNLYDYDEVIIGDFIRYQKAYLPTDFIKSIVKLYVDKTQLKGVEGKEAEYAVAKENINSAYGMMVTDICRDEILFEEEWSKKEPELKEVITKYNNSKRRFLFYPWGVWVTAYARFNLFTAILNLGRDYVYSDTDSVKLRNHQLHIKYFEDYNDLINYKIESALKYHGIPIEYSRPKTIKGVEKPLGVWDFEGGFAKFKTLGAKRYLTMRYNKENEKEYSLTVSGLNKNFALPYLLNVFGDDIFKWFDEDLEIPAEFTGKLTHTYIDREMDIKATDYLGETMYIHELSGTHLEKAEYSLSLNKKYVDFLFNIKQHDK